MNEPAPGNLPRLLVLLGPTASGKSALAIRLAQTFSGEVVACDSTQVYRHFDIGTGKVSKSEQGGIAHWMIDMVEPDRVFTAGDYRRDAEKILQGIRDRGKLPIVTAGTGLYLRALLEGLAEAPARCEVVRERLRSSATTHGARHLHRMLLRLDPEAASKIGAGDAQKIIRAIEIRLLTKQPVAAMHSLVRPALQGFRVIKVGLRPQRKLLYAEIDKRVTEMFTAGWVEEVRRLLAAGVSPEAKPFSFIGYRQIAEHLNGRLDLDETIAQIQQATRNFAKRQLTWFGRERDVNWIEAFGYEDRAAQLADRLLQAR
jgi:tRNA dimethylallyltransferase